jgi:hypothetical protein
VREAVDARRVRAFMEALGHAADVPCRVYLTGGVYRYPHLDPATLRNAVEAALGAEPPPA